MADKFGIDVEGLVEQFEQASAKQGDTARQAVQQATLKALQGRELTLKAVKGVVKVVTQAASAGASRNKAHDDIEDLLGKAVAGVDAAVRQAVEANHRALQQIVDQGVDLREKQVQKLLGDIEKMEDAMFNTIDRVIVDATEQALRGPWSRSVQAFRQGGSATGSAAADAVTQLTERARSAARDGRALSQRAARTWLDHYATLASGVLIGMSEALAAPASATPRPGKR